SGEQPPAVDALAPAGGGLEARPDIERGEGITDRRVDLRLGEHDAPDRAVLQHQRTAAVAGPYLRPELDDPSRDAAVAGHAESLRVVRRGDRGRLDRLVPAA